LVDPNRLTLVDVDVYFLSLGCYIEEHLQGIFLKKMKHIYVRAVLGGLMRIDQHIRRTEARKIYLGLEFDDLSNFEYDKNANAGIQARLRLQSLMSL
jgi:hypothetical protein